MRTIWKGQLTRDGRKPTPFDAEIVDVDGVPTLTERRGVEIKEVSPHAVNNDSWMAALVALAVRTGASGA